MTKHLFTTLTITTIILGATMIPAPAHAIIVLPAVILVPITKILAGIIAVFTVPAAGLSTYLHRVRQIPTRQLIRVVALLLLDIILITIIILRLTNPERPWW